MWFSATECAIEGQAKHERNFNYETENINFFTKLLDGVNDSSFALIILFSNALLFNTIIYSLVKNVSVSKTADACSITLYKYQYHYNKVVTVFGEKWSLNSLQ